MLPSLTVYGVFTIAISNLFTQKIYTFLNRIEQKVYAFVGNEIDAYKKDPISNATGKINSSGILELQHLEIFLQKNFELVQDKRAVEQELINVAAQAAHDICSSIATLNITLQKIPNITNEQREYIKKIDQSITNIAHGLMHKYEAIKNKRELGLSLDSEKEEDFKENANYDELPESLLISSIIKNVFNQKKVLFDEINIKLTLNIQQNAQDLYVFVNPHMMQRILSNIINNAAEAIMVTERALNGVVDVILEKQGSDVVITISDNGCGMPADFVAKIGQGKYTMGKKDGHGFGLYYAIQHIKSWHGTYDITTKLNVGTQFRIHLPIASDK